MLWKSYKALVQGCSEAQPIPIITVLWKEPVTIQEQVKILNPVKIREPVEIQEPVNIQKPVMDRPLYQDVMWASHYFQIISLIQKSSD